MKAYATAIGRLDEFVILKEDENGRYVEYAFKEGAPHDNRCLSWYDKLQPNALKRNDHDVEWWSKNRLRKVGEVYELHHMCCGEDGLDVESPEHCSAGHPRKICIEHGVASDWTYDEPVKCACWLLETPHNPDSLMIPLDCVEKYVEALEQEKQEQALKRQRKQQNYTSHSTEPSSLARLDTRYMTEEIEILEFETCKLLKEIGFNDLCEYLHTTAVRHDGKDLSYDEEMELRSEGFDSEIEYIEGGKLLKFCNHNYSTPMSDTGSVSAPDIYEAMRWLRKKHNINIMVDYNGDVAQWCWSVTDCSTGDPRPYDGLGDTFEDAAKNAIHAMCLVLKTEIKQEA